MPELYPETVIATTNLSGSVTELRNNNTDLRAGYAPDAADQDTILHVGMGDPGDLLDGHQTIRAYVRSTGNSRRDPTVDISLYESGSLVQTLTTATISALSGETVSATFDAAAVSSGSDVEVHFHGHRTSGMAGTRDTIGILSVTWDASLSGGG